MQVHVLEVHELDLLSVIPLMAMSVRILFTSHARCWSVGSRPYLPCHLALCASASMVAILAGPSDHSPIETEHPAIEVSCIGDACESTLRCIARAAWLVAAAGAALALVGQRVCHLAVSDRIDSASPPACILWRLRVCAVSAPQLHARAL